MGTETGFPDIGVLCAHCSTPMTCAERGCAIAAGLKSAEHALHGNTGPMQQGAARVTCQVGRIEQDSAKRKRIPITTGVLHYFPDAIAAVARMSVIGNDKHNPGQPLHWSREKSSDHVDCIGRHLTDLGTFDPDGVLHDVMLAWRALANLQLVIEDYKARGLAYMPE